MKPDISVFDKQYPFTGKTGQVLFGNQVLHYVRDNIFQRKVEISVKKVDGYGVFNGLLLVDGKDFGLHLVEKGFAKVHRPSIRKLPFFQSYKTAEETARQARIGLWEHYDFEEEKRRIAEVTNQRTNQQQRVSYPVAVTDVRSGSEFSFQILNDDETSSLESLSNSLQRENFAGHPPFSPKLHGVVAAQFTVDDLWYRAQILAEPGKNSKDSLYEVRYLDYGNREFLDVKRIRELPKEYITLIKPQARDAKLYYVAAPALTSEYGRDCLAALKDLLWDKVLFAEQVRTDKIAGPKNTEWKDSQLLYHLIIHEDKNDLNKLLVRNGHVKVEKVYPDQQDNYYLNLEELQEEARNERLGIWQYGADPDSDEEERL